MQEGSKASRTSDSLHDAKQALVTLEDIKTWYRELRREGNVASCKDCRTPFENTSGRCFYCKSCGALRAASTSVWSKEPPVVFPTLQRPTKERSIKQTRTSLPTTFPLTSTPKPTPAILSVLLPDLTRDYFESNANKALCLKKLPDLAKLATFVVDSTPHDARPLSKGAKVELDTLLTKTAPFLLPAGPLDALRYLRAAKEPAPFCHRHGFCLYGPPFCRISCCCCCCLELLLCRARF